MKPFRQLIWLAVAGLAGCVVVPIPKSHQAITGRRIISHDELAQLTVGSTTRSDVLLAFGEPDFVSLDSSQFAYTWNVDKAYLIVLDMGDSIPDFKIPEQHLVFLQFDQQGVLERIDVSEFYLQSIPARLRELGMKWAHEEQPAPGG